MRTIVDRIDTRLWPADYLKKVVGEYGRTGFCHANDPELRSSAASGGIVSATLIHLLETSQIDGALVVAGWTEAGRYHCGFRIARTRAEILAARGSKYMPVYFNREVPPLIKAFEGRLAAVLLPCDALALAKLRATDPAIDRKIRFVTTLFCGHNSERELTDLVIDRFRPAGANLVGFQHRFGHWRGSMRMNYDKEEVVAPFSEFSMYQNLFFFAQKKCHACFDHFGYQSDMAVGDIWSQKMKKDPVKKNAVILRTAQAEELLRQLIDRNLVTAEEASVEDVCNGQSRALPFHYNISARSRVGSLFGMRLKDTTQLRTRWSEVAAAFIAMVNERMTRSRVGRAIVGRIPRPLLKAYLALFKALESV